MLSTETPSCSNSKDSSALNLQSDERASDLVHGLHEHPNFSIRDYVSKSRSSTKDIRTNWPFSDQLLELCWNNGIRDVLPPFEPPSLVTAHSFRRQVYSEQLPKCSENKRANFEHEEDIELDSSAVECLDHSQLSLQVNKLVQSASENNVSPLTYHDDLIGGSSGEQLKMKCRLPEDLVSNSIAVSDPTVSKVCPVCKSFSSSSNTTLNAHIDQCLSSDQLNATRDVGELSKPKVKPMKKRLMVDIYTTALHCTLEDLDRRNGTNWATTNLPPVPPPADDISLEPKRTKFVPSASDGNVGDIYVDSNGTKLLILSKVNDSPSMVSRKNFKMKKQGKRFKEGRNCLITKKKSFKPSGSKLMNDAPHKKKLSVFDEIEESEGDGIDESDEENEEEFLPKLSNSCDQVRNNEPSPLGHWVCSKRSDMSRKNSNNDIYKSDLPRKIGNKDVSKGSVENIVGSRKLMVRHNQSDSGPSFVKRSPALNSPSSSKAVASPKTKGLNMLSSTTTDMESRKKRFHQASNLGSKSLCRDNSLDDSHIAETLSTYESHYASLKDGKSLTSKKRSFPRSACISLETRIVGKGEKFITPKKFQKFHCSKLRAFHGIPEESNKPSNNHQSNFSENHRDKSLGTTDRMRSSLTVAPISETNLDPIPEEHAESISGNEPQEESMLQRSMCNQEEQSENAISNELISHDTQLADNQTEAAVFQEPSPCSNEEMGLENTEENSSTTSVTVKSKKDRSMAFEMEPSGSPVSTTSEISPPSPIGTKTKYFLADQPSELTQVHGKISSNEVRKDSNVKLSPPVREPSCSCSESLSLESQLSIQSRKNMVSNLFVNLSTFSPYPTSCLTLDTSKPSDPCSCSSRTQSPSNPILRLMGKNLVVNKEESMHLPNILPCGLDYSPRPNLISFGHPNNIGFVNYNGQYHYQMQPPNNYQIPLQPPQPRPRSVVPSYRAQEVIVIDDDSHDVELATLPQTVQNPNPMAPQMPQFSCYPSQNPYASRAVVNPGQRQNPEGPFLSPSPSSSYFYQTMR